MYERPADFPNEFVARKWLAVPGDMQLTSDMVHGESLEAVRHQLPAGLYRLPRKPGDAPQIIETWF
ncbi:hypothetical protein D3C78_1884200 [compost metagenome]